MARVDGVLPGMPWAPRPTANGDPPPIIKNVQCGNEWATHQFPSPGGPPWISCTDYNNWAYACQPEACWAPANHTSKVPVEGKLTFFVECKATDGSAIMHTLYPKSFQAYNRCSRAKVHTPKYPNFTDKYWCTWRVDTDQNNLRPICESCRRAAYTPFTYGSCQSIH
ncbi:hypothetical protein O181_063382 [Austropuccinia psidii MF-1]|uniref:Uncharacterized protein n=1 Tax=Austropuccinia psidii MF-1 TaxID=1389203 RepID=A0A9Q3ETX0_9BASI|nr:hypothetical protein [Austropuccinia psidii MF-1]